MNLNHFMADKMPPNPEPAPEQTESVSAADTFDELPDGRIPQGSGTPPCPVSPES